jgi:hypothetical protein
MKQWFAIALAAILPVFFIGLPVRADDSPAEVSTADLELQVAALTTLDELDVTPDQIRLYQSMAAETAAQPSAGDTGEKPSSAYHEALLNLRDALASGDDDKIDDAQEKVDNLRDSLNIDPNLDYQTTDAAKTKARPALKTLSTSQIANYISLHADEIPDATDTILDALDQCKDGSESDFNSLRDEAASQVGLLAAGLDQTAADAVAQKVSDLLNKARQLPPRQFTNQRSQLDHEAHQITKSIDSFDAMHRWMYREMADLLSNPQISTALTLRAKSAAAQP